MAQENSDVVFIGESRRKRARVEPLPERDWLRMADRMAGRISERVSAHVSQQVAFSLSTECLECEEKDNRIRELELLLAEKSTAYEELHDSTMCSICVSTPPNRVLSCGHVFCSGCTDRIDDATLDEFIHCPTCRATTYKVNIRRVFL